MFLTLALEVTVTSRQCYGGAGMEAVKRGMKSQFPSHAPSHTHFHGRKCFLMTRVNFGQNCLLSLWLKEFQADISQRFFWFPPVLCETQSAVSWSCFFFHTCCSHQAKSPESCFQFLYLRP